MNRLAIVKQALWDLAMDSKRTAVLLSRSDLKVLRLPITLVTYTFIQLFWRQMATPSLGFLGK